MSKNLRKKAIPIATAIVGGIIGGPPGAAIGAGVGNYTQTHDLKSAALTAGGSYLGGNIAGNVLGNTGGTVIGGLEGALGPDLGSAIGQGLGSAALTPISQIVGSQIGGDLASSLVPQKTKNPVGESAVPFKPTRAAELTAPLSIQGLGSLTSNQQSSNIASQGVYGGGQGPEEKNYFLNLVNRRLVDDSGKVDTDFNDILPIENSYLEQLGLGNKKNPTDLLQAISSWRA